MTENALITANEDGSIITIRMRVQLKRHSGKKTIISPRGHAINQDRNNMNGLVLLNALVKAYRWQRMIDEGKYENTNQICIGESISNGYISTVMRMVTLAPDIQEAILNSTYPPHLTRADFAKAFPLDWQKQRLHFGF